MDPEFYVEKPNKLIALTIATLNAGISIGIAASLAGSLIALHARGGPGDLATTKPCPNSEYGILAFCIAAAILGTSYISAAVVRRAKPIHAELMRNNPRAGGSFGPERIVGFIMDVAGAPYVEAASLAFDAFKAKWSPSVREVVHWLLKGEPRPQVGKMLLMQGPAGGETQRRALLGYFSELWSFDVIERVARNATLDGGRVTISCWRDDREIVRVDEFAALRSKAKVIVNGWGPRDVERQLQKALTFERQQARIVEIGRPEVVKTRRVYYRSPLKFNLGIALVRNDLPSKGFTCIACGESTEHGAYLRLLAHVAWLPGDPRIKCAWRRCEKQEECGTPLVRMVWRREMLDQLSRQKIRSSDDDAVSASPLLAVGTQVEVTNCQHQGQWSGIVDDVNAEARSYAIIYDDDHYESDVEAERVREEYAASPAHELV